MKNSLVIASLSVIFWFFPLPAPPGPGTATTSFAVGCTVSSYVTVSASIMNFGMVAISASEALGEATITITAPAGLPYEISLDQGQHWYAMSRHLSRGATDYVTDVLYELYRDAARTMVWGTKSLDDSYSGPYSKGYRQAGSGAAAFIVYGKLTLASGRPAGDYSDAVTVTVYY